MKKCPISVHRAFFRSPYVVKTLFFTKDGAFFRSEELATLPKPPPSSPAKPSSHTLARGRGVWVRHSSIYYIRGWGGGGEKGEGGRGKMVPASSSAFFFQAEIHLFRIRQCSLFSSQSSTKLSRKNDKKSFLVSSKWRMALGPSAH